MSPHARRALLVVGVLLGGCSLFNDPDTDWIRDRDMGPPPPPPPMDGGEAGLDAGDADAEVPDLGPDVDMSMPPPVEICDGGADEDGDGLADCADSDCQTDFALCCGTGGSILLNEDLTDGASTSSWVASPAGAMVNERPGFGIVGVTGGALFLRASSPDPRCVPLDSGVQMVLEFNLGDDSGSGGSMGATLTRARAAGGGPLPAELRVVVTEDRRVLVEQGGLVRQMAVLAADSTNVQVTIELAPAATPIGTSGLLVTTRVSGGTVEPPSVIYVEHLLESEDVGGVVSACSLGTPRAGAGLYVALEGQSTSVALASVRFTQKSCLSPAVWTKDGPDLRQATQFPGEPVSVGDVGWANVSGTSDDGEWFLAADITNGDPDAEGVLFVPWALSLLYSDNGSLFLRPTNAGIPIADPIVGELCLPGMCGEHHANREPEIAESVDGAERSILFTAWACEKTGAGDYGLYDLCLGVLDIQDARTRAEARPLFPLFTGPDADRLLLSTVGTTYRSFRSPAIVPRSSSSVMGVRVDELRVFAVAEDMAGELVIVTARVEVSLPSAAMPTVAVVSGPVLVARASDFGAIASKGLRSLTAIRQALPGDDLSEGAYRLWFVTEAPGAATISYATVAIDPSDHVHVEAYGANPILRPGAGALSACAAAAGDRCRIRGVSATLRPHGDPERVALLVSYDEPAHPSGVSSRLVVLSQPLTGTP